MKIKKILSMLLIAALCLGTIPAGVFAQEESLPQEAAAEAIGEPADPSAITPDASGEPGDSSTAFLPEGEALTEDGFQYRINEAGEVTITQYKGDAADLVVPAAIDGKRVSTIDYGAFSNNDKLTSVVIEEGVGAIGNNAFYNCANLAKIDLPSTITSIDYGAFSNCALTDTNGFKKLANLKENTFLPLQNNQITDLSGLKGLSLYGIYLNNNADLKDVSPLEGMASLEYLFLDGTAVPDESLWALYHYDTLKLSLFDIGSEVPLLPEPIVYTDRGIGLNSQITYTVADPSVVTLLKDQTIEINKIGETTATATYNGEHKRFKIIVQDMEQAPEAGKPVENLPTLAFHNTPNGTDKLNLKENGELWNISADTPELVKGDVKSITTSQIKNSQRSWLFIQDQADSLWVQETKAGQEPTLSKKVENVAKYVGNNAYDINNEASTWGWVMHKEGGLSYIRPDGTAEAAPVAGTKDIANLGANSVYARDFYYGLTVLKDDGTVLTRVGDQRNSGLIAFEPLAKKAVALTNDNGFIDTDGFYHRINVQLNTDKTYTVTEKILGDNAARLIGSSVYDTTFYIDKDGATWCQKLNNTPEKVGDMTMAYIPVSIGKSYNDPDSGYLTSGYDHYFQDTEKNLWIYDTQTKKTTMIDKDVAKTAVVSSPELAYLKTDGTYVNGDTRISGVADLLGDYLLMKDGRAIYRGQTILDSVLSIRSSVERSFGTNNFVNINDCYMTRTDGSVWLHSTRTPSVLTKVANYPEMAPVAVSGVTVAPATLEMTMGEAAKQLTATIMPADASNKAVKWTSSDEKIARVDDNGMVTAVGAGKATITATTVDGGFKADCTVSVNKPIVHVTGIALDKTAVGPMTIGYYETLKATVSPADADNKAVAWSSDNAAVAAVDQNGKITSVGAGSATITATTADGGFKASCSVTVDPPKAPVATTGPIEPSKPTEPVQVSNTEVAVTVPEDVIAAVPEIKGAELRVESVVESSDPAVQEAVATTKTEVENKIEGTSEMLQLLDFSFVKDNEEVAFDGTQTGVSVKLTVKITPVQKDAYTYFQVYAVNEDGTLGEKVGDRLKPDDEMNIGFDAPHFSKYVLVGIVEESQQPGGDKPEEPKPGEVPDNGEGDVIPVGTEVKIAEPGSNAGTGIITDTHTSAYLCAGMLVLAAAGLMALRKRRNTR